MGGGRWGLSVAVLVLILIVAEALDGDGNMNDGVKAFKEQGAEYKHVWPEMKFSWRIVVGSLIGFIGAAFGSVGGVGGGGFFIPMLNLIIGFDPKSSTALSKCMIMGAAIATVYYNLKQKHPTLDLPIIDYDLALLMGPMLILGIGIGVELNLLLANWMITILLILILFTTSSKSFLMGIETWKKETRQMKGTGKPLESTVPDDGEVSLHEHSHNGLHVEIKKSSKEKVSILENLRPEELGLLFGVWVAILAIQIAKRYVTTCSWRYWILDALQIPVTGAVAGYEALSLYKGRRVIASNGSDASTRPKVYQLALYCACGILGGLIGGLLGLGGGFIMGPVFLQLGLPPQVSSATATFVMLFSSSMSVVEYSLLRRFPVPYALYLVAVAMLSALVGQHVAKKAINLLGRASIIIFCLALTVFISALLLGGVGLAKMAEKIQHKEYMGFEDMCRM
ncbi:hypothetical protein QQ045_025768 [Rhodiola kirilowii]